MRVIMFTSALVAGILFSGCGSKNIDEEGEFIVVKNGAFEWKGNPYHFLGTNFWYAINLASTGEGGNRDRLLRELDRLDSMGLKNLRIVAGSEGPDTEPYRMVPSLQPSPGEYNNDLLQGLDFLFAEMKKRDMHAVVCLADFWNWSGGFGQYIVWSGAADSIPYPPPHPGGSWDTYQKFTAQFYSNEKAVEMLNNHIRKIVSRKNSITGKNYIDDPVIMAWELCNEPRGIDNQEAYRSWIKNTAELIKSLDKNHLVTIGSEGTTYTDFAGTDPLKDHSIDAIDYQTIHIWVQNWNIYDPARADGTYDSAVEYALNYIEKHEEVSRKLNKPLVLEEFGISRDLDNHDASSPTTIRDKYYEKLFATVADKIQSGKSPLAGCNFWAWGGEGRPSTPKSIWKPGDDFVGDPPHEYQGWYSVYHTDSSTVEIIARYAKEIGE